MQQAATTIMVGLCLVLTPWAKGEPPPTTPANGPISKARKLIDAGDHAAALHLLEDALLESPPGDRPIILGLLRQSYEVLARKAEVAGRTREAAHYRDNLSILGLGPEASRAPQPHVPPTKPSNPTPAKAPLARMPGVNAPREGPRIIKPPIAPPPLAATSSPASSSLAEPAPLPEPAPIPAPEAKPERIITPNRPETKPLGDLGITPRPKMQPQPVKTRIPAGNEPIAPTREDDRDGSHAATTVPPSKAARRERESAPAPPDPDADADAEINPGAGTPEPASGKATDTVSKPAELPQPETATTEEPPAERPKTVSDLERADRMFTAGQYDQAGTLYAKLASDNELPTDRRPHWAYCRAKEVCRKINGRPRSTTDWEVIEKEVREIQQLTPGHWVGEYLRSLVAEERGGKRRPSGTRSNSAIIRGAEPEEVQPAPRRQPRLFGKPRGAGATPPPQPNPEPSPAPAASPAERSLNLPSPSTGSETFLAFNDEPAHETTIGTLPAKTMTPPGARAEIERDSRSDTSGWQVHESANFRIFHCDLAIARQAAEVAESVRSAQARRWGSPSANLRWTPRCDLFLHPTAQSYSDATGQPAGSPGISTMLNDGARVVARRINLRADNPVLLTATLPHELTHIVLADLFVTQQIPRWADEGIAVLAEPAEEQRNRLGDLHQPLKSGQVFPVAQLIKLDMPQAKDRQLFYAQSVSLTSYLVEQGPPERFIQFVRDSLRSGGVDAALRDVYQIEGLDDLHSRWLVHARKQVAPQTASSRDSESTDSTTSR